MPPEGHMGGDRNPGGSATTENQCGEKPHQGQTQEDAYMFVIVRYSPLYRHLIF